jgi:serine/threonine protein kinase
MDIESARQPRTNQESEFDSETCSCSLQDTVARVGKGFFNAVRDELLFQNKIGEGEFGVVFKGIFRGNTCAVKMLKRGIKRDSSQYRRMLMELSILAIVKPHTNVIRVLGACLEDMSKPLIIEEYVDGLNLEDHLTNKSDGFNIGKRMVQLSFNFK